MTAKQKLLSIVEKARGDDLERAERAFQGMSDLQLDQQHGESGQSRRQMLESYRQERAEWKAAHLLVLSL